MPKTIVFDTALWCCTASLSFVTLMSVKAIPTKYKGCVFRSRLEARWAVFLDALGIEWAYEPEGFTLENGVWYLPDFYLPEKNLWLEIKGDEPNEAELEKAWFFEYELERGNHGHIYILCGDIPYPYPTSGYAIHGIDAYPGDAGQDFCWQQCPVCLTISIWSLGREFCTACLNEACALLESWMTGTLDTPEDLATLPNYLNLEAFLRIGGNVDDFQTVSDYERGFELLPQLLNKEFFRSGHKSRELRKAYAAARSARFEHGASGRSI